MCPSHGRRSLTPPRRSTTPTPAPTHTNHPRPHRRSNTRTPALTRADIHIHDNFIAECGSCIELRGWGQASKITDNLIGAGFKGHSIYAENHGGLLITANNMFPRGASSVHFDGVTRSSLTNNRLHSFYPGMVILAKGSSENLIASNHFLRDREPWTPFLDVDNGLDDTVGLLSITGSNNSVIGNHFSNIVDRSTIRPAGTAPNIIRLSIRSAEGH